MASEAFADISNAVMQDELANSLLGDEAQVAEVEQPEAIDLEEQTLEDRLMSDLVGEEEQPEAGPEQAERYTEESQAEAEQQQVTAPIEVTPQAIEQSIQAADAFIAEHNLIDPAESVKMVTDLGLPIENAETAGRASALIGITAMHCMEQAKWNLDNVQPLHPSQLRAVHDEFCRGVLHIDPRMSPVESPESAGADILFMASNFFQTVHERGINAALDQLNDPVMAEAAVNRLYTHFGINDAVSRRDALHYVDAATRPWLSLARKLSTQREQIEQEQPVRRSRSSSARQVNSRAGKSRFQSNQDIFDEDTMELYRREHGRI